jgi:hypothetical protein
MKSAYPEIYTEDLDDSFDAESFEDSFPDIVEEISARERSKAESLIDALLKDREANIRGNLEDTYAQNLALSLSGIRESVEESVRASLLEDPNVGGSRAVLTKIAELVSDFEDNSDSKVAVYKDAISSKDEEISDLKEELEDIKLRLHSSVSKLKVEETISSHPKSDNIRKLIGDPANYEDLSELEDRLYDLIEGYEEFVIEEEKSIRVQYTTVVDGLRSEFKDLEESYESQVAELESELSKLNQVNDTIYHELSESRIQVEKAIQLAEEWENKANSASHIAESAKRYASKREKISGYANSNELMNLVEDIEDDEKVDEVIKLNGSHRMSDSSLEEARQKIKRGSNRVGGKDLSEVTDELPLAEFNERLFDGLTPSRLQYLSGLK